MRYLKNMSSIRFNPEKCKGCARCVEVCPHGVFDMKDNRAVLQDKDGCMECGACQRNCSFGAIEVEAGVGCAAAILQSMKTGGEATCGCS
jgi:NAD-dependent dihydropyrimidine dehydrogenase PreA subunit